MKVSPQMEAKILALASKTAGGGVEKQEPKKSKYKNVRVQVGGLWFHSKEEAKRYCELKLLLDQGLIHDLQTQVTYKLEINGILICKYISDFIYREDGKNIVEDAKGYRTDVYKIKKKLMKALLNIEIRET